MHEQLQENAREMLRASLGTTPVTSAKGVQHLVLPVQLLWHQADLGADLSAVLRSVESLLPITFADAVDDSKAAPDTAEGAVAAGAAAARTAAAAAAAAAAAFVGAPTDAVSALFAGA